MECYNYWKKMNVNVGSGSGAGVYSAGEWEGSKPQKFKGGRKHNNHPLDQLDNLLLGSSFSNPKLLGPSKKRFEPITTIGTDQPPKPHIRPNIDRTSSNIVFDCESVPKLIKLPPVPSERMENSILFRGNRAGESKIRGLADGELRTGIYRNFYRANHENIE